MGIDYEKLRKAKAEIQARTNRGGGPSMKFWRPNEGQNRIRILPPWTQDGPFAGQFYREVHQHWGVSENSGPVLCPAKTPEASDNHECPICDFVDQLRERKNDLEAQNLVKDLRAKVAYLMSVVDLRDPVYTAKDVADFKTERPDAECPYEVGAPKVQCFAASTTVADAIMDLVINNEMDITDLEAGFNLTITKISNPKNKLNTKYTVTPELKKTKAPITAEYQLPDLSKIGRVQSAEDMLKLLGEGKAASFIGLLGAGESQTAADTSWAGAADDGDLGADMRASLG